MNRYSGATLAREIVTIVVALVMMIPFYFLVNVALKSDAEALSTPAIALPAQPTIDAFSSALEGGTLLAGLFNSVVITGGTVIALVFIGAITAYVIARRTDRLSTLSYLLVLVGIILPFQLGLVPAYVAMRSLGLIGTYTGMIILYVGLNLPLAIFLYVGFARAIPREYEEAAEVDGASRFQTFRRIVFPLLAPATGTVAILTGLGIWNDFFNGLIFLSGSPIPTLPVAVYNFVGADVTQWNVVFAALVIAIIPVLVAYLVAQRKFIQGFAGGIKS